MKLTRLKYWLNCRFFLLGATEYHKTFFLGKGARCPYTMLCVRLRLMKKNLPELLEIVAYIMAAFIGAISGILLTRFLN